MMNSSFKICTYHKCILKNTSILSKTSWNLLFHECKHYHEQKIEARQKMAIISKSFHSSHLLTSSCSRPSLSITTAGVCYVPIHSFSTSKVEGIQSSQAPADLFFPDFPTIEASENVIIGIHNLTGLPWWSSIIASAFLLRILLPLPLSVYSMHNSIRLQRLQPEIKEVAQQLKKEVSMAMHQFGWDQKKAKLEYIKNLKRNMRKLYIRDNCHPMKDTASFWIRIPLWVSASYALRNMSVRASNPLLANHESCQSLSTEGIAWFADLTVVDSTWILPVMMGMVTLLNVEVGRRNVSEMTTYRKVLTYALRGLSLVFIPVCSYLPSGLVLYWVSSGLFSAIQTGLFDKSSTVHSLIGIKPPMSSQPLPKESKSDTPQQ